MALLLRYMLCVLTTNTTPSTLNIIVKHIIKFYHGALRRASFFFFFDRLTGYQLTRDCEVTLGNDSLQTIQKESILPAQMLSL